MRSDDRRDLATATVGAGGLAAGGVMRHAAVRRIRPEPKVHLLGVLRNGTRGQKKLFAAGSTLGLLATAPLAVGTTRLAAEEPVRKDDSQPKRGFWREGLAGSAEALKGRADSARQPVPAKVRGMQLGVAGAAGLGGSALTRAMLPKGARAAVGPVAGALAATGSVPLTNHLAQKHGYEVTAYGVRRSKKPIVRPSSKASTHRQAPRSFREDLSKADSYLGSRTPYGSQRAAITAANHVPVVGGFASAGMAGKYAPPGQARTHTARQFGLGVVAPAVAGVGGAYGGAHLGTKSKTFERRAGQMVAGKDKAENWARAKVGMGTKKGPSKLAVRAMESKLARPLLKSPVGAIAGFAGAKAIAGIAGEQGGITLNQRAQSRYNAKHGISKAGQPQTKRERHSLAERKRMSAALSVGSGLAGLSGLGLLAAGKKGAATSAGIIGGGLGGTNSLLGAGVQRQEAKAIDPVKKGHLPELPWTGPRHVHHKTLGRLRIMAYHPGGRFTVDSKDGTRLMHRDQLWPKKQAGDGGGQLSLFDKRDYREPLKTSVSEDDARKLVARHGLTGPLPKTLDREQRRAAYEARYTSAGGHKAEHWQHRAQVADKVKTGGLATATAAGVPWLASRTGAGRALGRAMTRHIPAARKVDPKKLAHHAETVAGAAATVSGGGELYAAHARRKRSSYASAPAGVAASALRRMQAYDTGGAT